MTTWTLIPVKGFSRAKSRLSEVLSPKAREALARELFEHVAGVVRESPDVDGIAVISDSESTRKDARRLGLVAIADPPGDPGLAAVVDHGLRDLTTRKASRAIVCMSDLPELTAGDVATVLRALRDADVVLVPDRSGRGTNVIALSLPSRLPSSLGNVDSLRGHLAGAESRGLNAIVQHSPTMAFDVDHPSDLEHLSRKP